MSTDQVINPELIEQTKQQIRGLVGEIAQLARQDIGAAEFYSEFLNRVVTALAAVGGAVWTVADGGGLQLEYQVNLRETRLGENEEDTARHGRLLHKVLRSGEGALAAPFSGAGDEADDKAGNPTPMLLVLGPVTIEGEPQRDRRSLSTPQLGHSHAARLSEVPDADVRADGRLSPLAATAPVQRSADAVEPVGELHARRGTPVSIRAWPRSRSSTRRAGLIGCDRVSVAIRKGNKCRIEADQRPGRDGQALEHRRATGSAGHGRGRRRRAGLVLGRYVEHGAASRRGAAGVCRRIARQERGRAAAYSPGSRPRRRRAAAAGADRRPDRRANRG